MIHAGANAGVYELKAMAFETVDSFLRAGELLFFFSLLTLEDGS